MKKGKVDAGWKILLGVYCSILFVILLFTYTQIDLSLTLSQQSIVQSIQKSFQYLGYFNRPVSSMIYAVSLISLFLFYGYIIIRSYKNSISLAHVWLLLGITLCILSFTYPAASSYDIFNYIFTARTVLLYHQNPYIVKPLDFQGVDSMLSFMRWTHLPSAYTPLWILLSIPFYLLSFHSLLLSFFTMRIITTISYLLCVYFLQQIVQKQEGKEASIISMVLFAFNPVVLFEGIISGHNDLLMMMFALCSIWLYIKNYKVLSFFTLSLSIATKLMTIFLLPAFFTKYHKWISFISMAVGLFLVLLRREFLPWYFLWILPFAVLLPRSRSLQIVMCGISLGLLLRYIPVYLYGIGSSVSSLQMVGFIIPIIFSSIIAVLFGLKQSHSV